MAFFRYVGIAGLSNPAKLYHYGVLFELGEVSEIQNPVHAEKLRLQQAFEAVSDEAAAVRRKPGRPKRTDAASAARPQPQQKFRPVADDDESFWDADNGKELAATDHPRP
jgi:hypothetical protein